MGVINLDGVVVITEADHDSRGGVDVATLEEPLDIVAANFLLSLSHAAEREDHPVHCRHVLRARAQGVFVNVAKPFGEQDPAHRSNGMTRHLVVDQIADFSIPPEYGAEHLASEVVIGQTGIVRHVRLLVRHVTEAASRKLEQVLDRRLLRASNYLIAQT